MTSPSEPDELLLVSDVEAMLRIPAGTLRHWRSAGKGPKSFKFGRRTVYRRSEVLAWVAQQEQDTGRGGNA